MLGVIIAIFAFIVKLVTSAAKAAAGATRRVLFGKKGNPSRKRALLLTIALTAFAALTVCFCVWFVFDDFMLYWLLLSNDKASESRSSNLPDNWSDSPYIGGNGNGNYTDQYGVSGVEGMYINAMNSGFYREMLEIVRDTANGSLIQDGFFTAYSKVFPNGRSDYKGTPVTALLGMHLTETGVCSEDGFSPNWYFLPSQWDQASGMTLSNYNSAYIRDKGITTFANGWTRLGKKNNNYYGPYQFSLGWWFNNVDGQIHADRPTNANFYPSKMNGYNVSGRRPGRWEDPWPGHDVMYYPDNVAMAVQYSCYNFTKSGTTPYPAELKGSAKVVAMYALHGGGEATLSRYYANCTAGSNADKMKVAQSAWNYCASILDQSKEYVLAHGDELNVSWFTQYTWEGWAGMSVVLNGGFFRTQEDLNGFVGLYNRNSNFRKGALLAFRYFRKNDSATDDNVRAYLDTLSVKNTESKYGTYFSQDKDYNVYLMDPNTKAIRDDGVSVQAVAMWNSQALFGGGAALIEGPRSYWKMLNAAGVECTLEDAGKDIDGTRVVIPGSGGPVTGDFSGLVPKGDNPNGSYFYGTRKPVSFDPGSTSLPKCNSVMYWRKESEGSLGIHFGEDFGYGVNHAAVFAGTVYTVGYDKKGWGNYCQVIVDAPPGSDEPQMKYTYAHMKEVYVKKGQHVDEGTPIGKPGNTGYSKGTHMHLELWVYDKFIPDDAANVLSFRSIYEGLYTPASGPRVRRIRSGAKTNSTECIVYASTGKKLGLLSEVNSDSKPEYCRKNPVETAGINYFMNAALQEYAIAHGMQTSVRNPGTATGTTTVGGVSTGTMNTVLQFARSKKGWKYVWGGESDAEGGYDCSGLVFSSYKAAGITLSRTAHLQRQETVQVSFTDLQPGDLFFFHKNKIGIWAESEEAGWAHHVGIVVGRNGPNASDLMVIDSNKWSGTSVSQDGVLEAAITRQIGRNAKVSANKMYIEYDLHGGKHYVTFGRYVGKVN